MAVAASQDVIHPDNRNARDQLRRYLLGIMEWALRSGLPSLPETGRNTALPIIHSTFTPGRLRVAL